MKLKDSGTRRTFQSGAVRDCADGKGRCDLLPLQEISALSDDPFFKFLSDYIYSGDPEALNLAMDFFIRQNYPNWQTAVLEVAKQYEDGAKKYADRNFENGIPMHCYIDSATRHYLKFTRGDKDEPHDRAVLWNLLSGLWTHNNHPSMHDLPFANKETVTGETT